MFAKVFFASCMVVAALARPDRLPSSGFGGGYSAPQPQNTYSQPRQQQQQTQRAYSQPQPSYSEPEPSYGGHSEEKGEPMPFNFNYEVKDEYSGNDYSHQSDSDGHVVKGEYRVLLPDGRTQIVSYTADHELGYNAVVTYEGEARYDEPQQQSYQQPQAAASYQQPRTEAPRNSYQQPEQPRNTYQQPRTEAPRNTYQQPRTEAPRNTYQQPSRSSFQQPPRNSYGF